ncbi:MAG TPA: BrnT family toxin [Terracidiphilus sp.]|jgi:hypothetical protein|nr:BrnT family toxin [Terracidiphilus sp.]
MDELNFEWDDANIGHIAQHEVTPDEAEETILSNPIEFDFEPDVEGEPRWTYVGETLASRILLVLITMRSEKIRVVTAFEPIKRIKTLYLQSKVEQQ